MSAPITPRKRRKGEEINEIARDLNSKWGLGLPIREGEMSPSKVANRGGKASQVYQRIRLLYFKDEAALRRIVEDFENFRAPYIRSQWVYKPGAETDTLPANDQGISLLRRQSANSIGLDDEKVTRLLDTLLLLLPESNVPLSLPSDGSRSNFGSTRFGRTTSRVIPLKLEPTSSNDYLASQETVGFMKDLDLPGAGVEALRNPRTKTDPTSAMKRSGSDEEVFSTPPTTPALLAVDNPHSPTSSDQFRDDEMTDIFHEQMDMVDLQNTTETKTTKRHAHDREPSPLSRKIAKGCGYPQLPQAYQVKHLIPVKISQRFSTTSSTSFSTTTSGSARASFSTSFGTESTSTSFGPSLSDNDTKIQYPVISDRNHSLESKPTTPKLDSLDTSRIDLSTTKSLATLTLPPPNATLPINGMPLHDYLHKHLVNESPLSVSANWSNESASFREIYEITRVARHCQLDPARLWSCVRRKTNEYGEFWSFMSSYVARNGKVLPERSSADVWAKAEEMSPGLMLTGDLVFSQVLGAPLFRFLLRPIKAERSSRLTRKWGTDRFLVLGLPGLLSKDLPEHLKRDVPAVRDAVVHWLCTNEHYILGRRWKAFYVKPRQKSAKSRQNTPQVPGEVMHRAYLFAVDGFQLETPRNSLGRGLRVMGPNVSMTVGKMLDWFMPSALNKHQTVLKLFARIALGVSSTRATVEFKSHEIIRSDDAFANCPAVRRLHIKRSEEKKMGKNNKPKSDSTVMNDGCARISSAAAFAIAQMLGIQGQVPCVFQGRIGGAKGVWMVDAIDENLPIFRRKFWIEITDSQLKFEGHLRDKLSPDPARVTFEVHDHSTPVSSSSLNLQLMPILIDRGVRAEELARLLQEDLTGKVANLEAAMDSRVALRKWNQENDSVTGDRVRYGGVKMIGGLPYSLAEKVNWAVEHGFEPKTCPFLRDLCFKSIQQYCDRLENNMKIGLGRSCIMFMIADPLALLDEGEVHVGFSSAFLDSKSGFQDTLLNNTDLLVARLPAHLPSDMQKVHAVFKPELSVYKDVIVFSSKGKIPLAEKLSGGDYDGDRAWICWEPDLVQPFQNAEVHEAPPLEYYGLTKDNTTVGDIFGSDDDYANRFLVHAFNFNIQPPLLGAVTHYFEAYCYAEGSISSTMAKNIGSLLGLLVDSAKGGFIFNYALWDSFKRKHNLPMFPPKPAYKDKDKTSRTDNIIDYLMQIAKEVRQKALGDFSAKFKGAEERDDDLTGIWKSEDELATKDPGLRAVLKVLQKQIDDLHDFWVTHIPSRETHTPLEYARKFDAVKEQNRDQFLAIRPLESSTHPMATRWRSDTGSSKGSWQLLKASALFQRRSTGSFPWWTCGKELGEIKLRAMGKGHWVVEDLYVPYRLDAKMVGRMEGRGEEVVGGEEGEEEDEFRDEGWEDAVEELVGEV